MSSSSSSSSSSSNSDDVHNREQHFDQQRLRNDSQLSPTANMNEPPQTSQDKKVEEEEEAKEVATIAELNLAEEYRKNRSVFGQILRGEQYANFIHQDEYCVAFHDIFPIAPVHFLIIPRKHIQSISCVTADDQALLGHMMVIAAKLAKKMKLDDGYRLVINDGRNGRQTVYHLHIHVIGGRRLVYPYA